MALSINHRIIYLLGLSAFLFGLAISEFLISVSQFLLAANWLLSANFKQKWSRIRHNKGAWAIWAFYLIHVIGMLYSIDIDEGLEDLRIKLPLLLMPLYIATEKPLSKKEFNILMLSFVCALFISISVSFVHYINNVQSAGYDVRQSFLFISHIRIALMLDLAIIWLLFLAFQKKIKTQFRVIALISALYFLTFLYLLQTLTGLIVLPIALFFAIIMSNVISKLSARLKGVIWFFSLGSIIAVVSYIYLIAAPFLTFEKQLLTGLEEKTAQGAPYSHDVDNLMLENGNQVWVYVSDDEARLEWGKISSIDFDGKGSTGEYIRPTLYRYLTSLGLKKDVTGIQKLTGKDITAIENGEANARFAFDESITKRVYQTIWELYNYKYNAGSHEGHSVAQRIEFWATGIAAAKQAIVFGNGTGDVWMAMQEQYKKRQTILSVANQLKPHNQFITIVVSLGIFGLGVFFFCLLMGYKLSKGRFFPLLFLITITLSFIAEDTLETQVGVSFFASFYALFFCQLRIKKVLQNSPEHD